MSSKRLYREQIRRDLPLLSEERREKAESELFLFLSTWIIRENTPVLSFASRFPEIDLSQLNHLLISQQKLLLPKVVDNSLDIYHVDNLGDLQLSSWNIWEPNPSRCKKAKTKNFSLVLVPGLVFDKKKHRIGFGKGYYDRFFSSCAPLKKWGIGFQEQSIETIPIEPHDQVLDEVFLF